MTPSQTTPTLQPGDCLVAAIEAQTVAIGRAMSRSALILLTAATAATAGLVVMVLVAG